MLASTGVNLARTGVRVDGLDAKVRVEKLHKRVEKLRKAENGPVGAIIFKHLKFVYTQFLIASSAECMERKMKCFQV